MSSTEEKEQIRSSTDEDQSPEEKRQKLERDDPFYIFHCDRETYLKKLYDFSIVKGDDCVLEDEEREFTEEEAKLYYAALKATGGFDVPDFPPEVNFCGMIIPVPVRENTLKYLLPYSVAAIRTFNQKYGTDYKVVQVEKAMRQGARGIKYYITFQVKIDDDNSDTVTTDADNSDYTKTDDDNSDTAKTDDDNSGAKKTFEASVLKGIPKKKGDDATQVIFCREKGGKRVAEGEKLDGKDEEGASEEEAEESEDEEGASVEEAEESEDEEGGSVEEGKSKEMDSLRVNK
ncbi:hypothetical protein PTKIN_Ptkin19aG0071900 [Pterospermum kingtungense]